MEFAKNVMIKFRIRHGIKTTIDPIIIIFPTIK